MSLGYEKLKLTIVWYWEAKWSFWKMQVLLIEECITLYKLSPEYDFQIIYD